ncbi:hypothetical protein ACTFIR_001593 [Dictyostelium discoideum]
MLSVTNKILRNNQYLNKLIFTPLSSSSSSSSSLSLVSINNDRINFNRYYIKKPSVSITPNYEPEKIKSAMGLDEGAENLEMDLDEKYIEEQLNPKIEKSKREINQKKKIKISSFDLYLDETENFKEPQVDLVDDDQLHVFPPRKKNFGKTSLSRPKQNPIHDERPKNEIDEEYENQEEDFEEEEEEEEEENFEEEREELEELEEREELEEQEEIGEEEIEEDDAYGRRRERRVHQEDRLPMEAKTNLLKKKGNGKHWESKIIYELNRKKKLLSEVGFADEEISEMFPNNQNLGGDPTSPSNYITNKVFSNHEDIKKLSIRLYEVDKLKDNRTKFNDDAINLKSVQVINVDGTNIGMMSGPQAYRLAYTKKLDIILTFSLNGKVYGRLVTLEDFIKISEKRSEQERERKIDHATKGTKGVIISSNINENDRLVKFDQIVKFLLKRHSVEVTITYKQDKKDRAPLDSNSPIAQEGPKTFALLEPLIKGIGRVQTNVEKNGLLISRFYQPLTVKERQEHLKRVERKENTEAERLKEKLERDEIDRLYELGLDADPVQVAASVAATLKRMEIEKELAKENITQAQLDLFEEEEREKERKRKEREERFKLAPVSGEGLSNKQIKQNKNKNKNLEKKLKKNNDDDELF